MRAMVLRRGSLAVEDVPAPVARTGQVLARVLACGICGSDLHFARHLPELSGRGEGELGVLRNAAEGAVVMGHEFVVEIAELGPGVEGWRPGDRATSVPTLLPSEDYGPHSIGYSRTFPGAYGEYMVLSAALLNRVPDGLGTVTAALTEPCAVALHAVRESGIAAGQRSLVMGAGPIGVLTMLWLRHQGVWAAVSDPAPQRRKLAAALGADEVIDPTSQDVAAALRTADGPAPFVFECVGVEGTLQQAMELVAPRGKVVVAGVCMVEDRIRPLLAINKQLNLQFVLGYSREEFAEAQGALASGAIDGAPLVTRTVGLDELPAAFAALSDPSDCKVVLTFPE